MSFNQVLLVGNLTRDCEVRYTPNGKAICKFGLAVNEKWRGADGQDRENVLFIDITFFDKRGEAFAKYHRKGDSAFIVGKLQLEQWDDKQTGAKRSKHSIVGNDWQFVGGKKAEGARASSDDQWPKESAPMTGRGSSAAMDDGSDTPF